ncbi:rhomboid family intramembrane serine protease [Bdellovibrio sp. HCB209]|uniref:rhomboid family intramembrane serine protease n=1 Tax=Bdellovibrio sp. HCB209 TaxID=3394354 RepID=UPI0039B4F806
MEQSVWKRVRETWLTQKPSPLAGFISAMTVLILVIGAVSYWQGYLHADQWMAASKEAVFNQHQVWRLWTTLFAHGDTGHLLNNLFLFFILGYLLVGYFGSGVFPIAAMFFGGLTNYLVLMNYPPEVKLIGASGVVYWMGGAWLALYFMIDQKRSYLQRTLRAGGVALGIFMPTSAFDPQVSYGAHLVGFILGVAFGLFYYSIRRQEFQKALVYEYIVSEDEEPSSSEVVTPTELAHPNTNRHGHSEWN